MWRRKSEGAIRDLLVQHGQAVLATVKALHKYIMVIREKKPDERLKDKEEHLAERVLELEVKADQIEDALNEELFKVPFLPITSSDRFDLVTTIDNIADRCEIVVRKLRILGEPIQKKIKKKLTEMVSIGVEATSYVVESLELMSKDFDAALSKARQVSPVRDHNRTVEFETLKILVESKMKSSTLLLLNDITQLLGRIGDGTKQAADVIVRMIIKYRS